MGNLMSLLAGPALGGGLVLGLAWAAGSDRTTLGWVALASVAVALAGALLVQKRLLGPLARACPGVNPGAAGVSGEIERLREHSRSLEADLKAAREGEREARSSLRQSEERFQVAVRGANDGLWEWDLASDALTLSPRWKAMLGYTAEEFPDRREAWQEHLHPDDRQAVDELLHRHCEGEGVDLHLKLTH